jgi:hypothetical protein
LEKGIDTLKALNLFDLTLLPDLFERSSDSFTRLSLDCVTTLLPIYVASIHSLNIAVTKYINLPYLRATPLTSLSINSFITSRQLDDLLRCSPFITSLSVFSNSLSMLATEPDSISRQFIQDNISSLKVVIYGSDLIWHPLIEIIMHSTLLTKVILDGSYLDDKEQETTRVINLVEAVQGACNERRIELWKEQFMEVGRIDSISQMLPPVRCFSFFLLSFC